MQRMKTAALATFAALVALPPGTGWAQEAVSVSAEVRENVRARVEAGLVPGIVVGMIDGAGTRYFAEGSTALSGGATPDARTVFEVGSVTKVFTAVLLAQMAPGDARLGTAASARQPLPGRR